jgi:hypothetical protein
MATSSCWDIVFTVAWVPTGMKTGVSMTECGVLRIPARAPVTGQVRTTSNENCSDRATLVLYHLE